MIKMNAVFFENYEGILRTLIITVLAYFTMVFFLRISGKRTLSKMNAFDFIVTIALGSSLATVALNKNVPLLEGALVFFLLIFLQYFITWLSVRVKSVKKIITSQPSLLVYKGEVLNENLKKERITLEEIFVAARKEGVMDLKNAGAVILETTGDITIIPAFENGKEWPKTLKDVNFHL